MFWCPALPQTDRPIRATNHFVHFVLHLPAIWRQDPKNTHANVTKQAEQAADRFMVERGRNRERKKERDRETVSNRVLFQQRLRIREKYLV